MVHVVIYVLMIHEIKVINKIYLLSICCNSRCGKENEKSSTKIYAVLIDYL